MLKHSLTWEKQQRDPVKERDYLTFGLVRTGICVMLQNDKFEYEYIANLPKVWTPPSSTPPDDLTMFGASLSKQLFSEKQKILSTGKKSDFEWTTPDGGTFRFIVELVFDRDKGREIFTTVMDLTDERRRENILRVLLKEVSHRSKNLLAIVQSLASQTARHSDSLERFVERFRGRIQSISHSQDVITQTDWQGSQICELIATQKRLFSPSIQNLIHFEGENVMLSPNATMHLGLALHELISNATQHGSFVERNCVISIEVSVSETLDGEKMINFAWNEQMVLDEMSRAQSVSQLERQFGSVLLERVVPTSVSGRADIVWTGTNMLYTLSFPQSA